MKKKRIGIRGGLYFRLPIISNADFYLFFFRLRVSDYS